MITDKILKKSDIVGETALSREEKIAFFEETLRSLGREGMDGIIDMLRKSDFYTAPSSSTHHSNYNGGLLDHSLLVYSCAISIRNSLLLLDPSILEKLPTESIAISALLHDVCKICFYRENTKWRKDENDKWESYIGYEIVDSFPIGHGEKSVIMLQMYGLKLNVSEMLAIRYHMGMWEGVGNSTRLAYQRAIDSTPMISVIQSADNISSLLLETKIEK